MPILLPFADHMDQIYFTFRSLAVEYGVMEREISKLKPKPILKTSQIRKAQLVLAE